jgi:hypothetical protein
MFKVHEIYDTKTEEVVDRFQYPHKAENEALQLNNIHKMKIAWKAVNLSSKGGWKRPTITTKTKGEYGNIVKTETSNPKHKLLVETLDKLKGERYVVKTHNLH